MEIALFMSMIGFASVFVLMSLGYSNKKTGYGSRFLGKIFGGGKTDGHKYEGSSIIDEMSAADIQEMEAEAARLEQKRVKHDAHADNILEILGKHGYGSGVQSEDNIPKEWNTLDDGQKYDKTGEERKEIPDNLDDIMAAWEKGEDLEPVYHKKGHPHGA